MSETSRRTHGRRRWLKAAQEWAGLRWLWRAPGCRPRMNIVVATLGSIIVFDLCWNDAFRNAERFYEVHGLTLAPVDYLILALYFAFVLGIGWLVKRRVTTSEDFLTSGRSVPVWITSLAFIAANLGRAGSDRHVRVRRQVRHHDRAFLLDRRGARPCSSSGVFMMPFYYGSRARCVPEYLKLRFDEKTRALQRHHVRGDDHLFLRHLACMRSACCFSWCWAGASPIRCCSRPPSCWPTPSSAA